MKNIEIKDYIINLCRSVKAAETDISAASAKARNRVLLRIAEMLTEENKAIIEANWRDLEDADANGVPKTMLDRLKLDKGRIEAIALALEELAKLPDVLGGGEVWIRPNGLEIKCQRVPMGVVAIIYEARPNVTVDAAALCVKTGNAVILRGGKEAINTNRALVSIMKKAFETEGLNPDAIALVDDTSREGSTLLMTMREYVDVLIPRGGKGLIKSVVENSRIPVIETGAGNCHLYIDSDAEMDMALNIALNAKVQRPSVCNAIETLLIHQDIAEQFLPAFETALRRYNVEIRGCEETRKYIKEAKASTEEDYFTEYNDYIIAVKVVKDVAEAVSHINKYGTKHSEAIVTSNIKAAEYFKRAVDSAAVYVNASTRFTDGGEFGFGAEIGISTQKLHARGPMGLEALTTIKYTITGDGQIR